jgi:multiple sugar transport system permease protein
MADRTTKSSRTATAIRASARGRRRRHDERWLAFLGLLLISVGFVLPFLWMLSTSLKTLDKTMELPPHLIPHPVVFRNYSTVLQRDELNFPLLTHNTLVVAILSVIGTTLSSAIPAYGFAKIRFKGRGILFGIMLATMMVPFPVMMVPLFSIFRWIGDLGPHLRFAQVTGGLGPPGGHPPLQMLGTLRPLWIPAWLGSAFNIFLLRQFFLTIPDELCEAAQLDGCSEWRIFRQIVLPLARPALAVVALFTFMGTWNDFLGPLVYIQDRQQYTLSLGLQAFQSQHGGTEWNLLMAASVMVILPVIVLFFLAQRTFIEGIATTGVKG